MYLETLPSREWKIHLQHRSWRWPVLPLGALGTVGPWPRLCHADYADSETTEVMKEGPYRFISLRVGAAAAGAKFISRKDRDCGYSETGVQSSSRQSDGQSKSGDVCSVVQSVVLLLKLRPCSSSCSLQTCIPNPLWFCELPKQKLFQQIPFLFQLTLVDLCLLVKIGTKVRQMSHKGNSILEGSRQGQEMPTQYLYVFKRDTSLTYVP